MEQFIVQFGSGKPGEMGTGDTERQVLKRIGIENPVIGFAPFHHIMHGIPNDWSLFQELVQPLTSQALRLFEFHKEKDMKLLRDKILECDLFVLGSGVCEPYLDYFFTNKVDEIFKEYFSLGKSFLGYSAGSICLNSNYIHVVFFRELFIHWNMMQQASKEEREEFKKEVLHECPKEHKNNLKKVLESKENPDLFNHHMVEETFQVTNRKALGFIPKIALLPHFDEAIHATSAHLQAAANRFPNHKHFGVPNGASLFHTFKKGRLVRTEVVGRNNNPKLQVTQFLKKDRVTYKAGEKIDLG